MSYGGDMGRLAGQSALIIGAGIAGLALARALAMRGAQVQVLEQAPAIREVGAGIQIAPNGAKVLRALGLGDDVARMGVQAQAIVLCDGKTGKQVARLDLTRRALDQDYYFLHRADLIDLLYRGALAAGVHVALGAGVASVDLGSAHPMAQLVDGQQIGADLLIGADGLHSVLRGAICGPETPFFTGQVAWRATIPGDGGPNLVQVYMGTGRHLVTYPLRGGALRNIVAVEERSAWAPESWTHQADHARFAAAFSGFAPHLRAYIHAAQEAGLWGLFRHPIAPVWGRILPRGCAFLLGDAAHPTLPFLAQGASMGLEDGAVLASLLDNLPYPDALRRYQGLRAPRVARIIQAANRNAVQYHLPNPMRSVAHLGLRAITMAAPNLLLRRYDWLYGYDATTGH